MEGFFQWVVTLEFSCHMEADVALGEESSEENCLSQQKDIHVILWAWQPRELQSQSWVSGMEAQSCFRVSISLHSVTPPDQGQQLCYF